MTLTSVKALTRGTRPDNYYFLPCIVLCGLELGRMLDRAFKLVLTTLRCSLPIRLKETYLTGIMWHVWDSSTESMSKDEAAGLQGPSSTICAFHMDNPALPVRTLIDLFNCCAQPDIELHAISI